MSGINYKHIVLIIFTSFLMSASYQSESGKEVVEKLKKCTDNYEKHKHFSFDVEYLLFYNGNTDREPVESGKGRFIRRDKDIYQEQFGVINILNSKYMITVYDEVKTIVVVGREPESGINPIALQADSLIEGISAVEQLSGNAYRLKLRKGGVEAIDFKHSSGYFIDFLRMHYRYPRMVENKEVKITTEVRYKNLKMGRTTENGLFETSSYLIIKNGELVPNQKFRGFRVINNTY